MNDDRSATLDGIEGRGYAVVESLPSLGKGRGCTGLFTTDAEAAARFEAARDDRRRMPFHASVHSRHVTRRVEIWVEVTRLEVDGDEVTAEVTAHDLPYDLGSA